MNAPPSSEPSLTTFPSHEEFDVLVLEAHRFAARLAQRSVITPATATAFMRMVNRDRRAIEAQRYELPKLILELLLGVESGTLKEGEHYVRTAGEGLALHLESIARPLFSAHGAGWDVRTMGQLLLFGARRFGHVVVERSGRARFGPADRRRVVVLHEAAAYEFVGAPKKVVPFR